MSEQKNAGSVLTNLELPGMLLHMSKVRLVLVVDDEIRDTLRAESGLSGEDMAEIVANLVRSTFPKTLKEVRARRSKADRRHGSDDAE